jgi:hypothetical protein
MVDTKIEVGGLTLFVIKGNGTLRARPDEPASAQALKSLRIPRLKVLGRIVEDF